MATDDFQPNYGDEDELDEYGQSNVQDKQPGKSLKQRYNDTKDNYDKIKDNYDKAKEFKGKLRAGKQVGTEAAKTGVKEGTKEVGKEVGKQAAKQVGKEAGKAVAKEGAKTAAKGAIAASGAATAGVGTAVAAAIEVADRLNQVKKKVDQKVKEQTGIDMKQARRVTTLALILAPIFIIFLVFSASAMFLANEQMSDSVYTLIQKRETRYNKRLIEFNASQFNEVINKSYDMNKTNENERDPSYSDILKLVYGDQYDNLLPGLGGTGGSGSVPTTVSTSQAITDMCNKAIAMANAAKIRYGQAGRQTASTVAGLDNMTVTDCSAFVYSMFRTYLGINVGAQSERIKNNGEAGHSDGGWTAQIYPFSGDTSVLQPGDILYRYGHVGLYVGGGKQVDHGGSGQANPPESDPWRGPKYRGITNSNYTYFIRYTNPNSTTTVQPPTQADATTNAAKTREYLQASIKNFNKVDWKIVDSSGAVSSPSMQTASDTMLNMPNASKYKMDPNSTAEQIKDTYIDMLNPYLQSWVVPYALGISSQDTNFSDKVLNEMYHPIDVRLYQINRRVKTTTVTTTVTTYYTESGSYTVTTTNTTVDRDEKPYKYIPKITSAEGFYDVLKATYSIKKIDEAETPNEVTNTTNTTSYGNSTVTVDKKVEKWDESLVPGTYSLESYKLSYMSDPEYLALGRKISRVEWYQDDGSGQYTMYPDKTAQQKQYVFDTFLNGGGYSYNDLIFGYQQIEKYYNGLAASGGYGSIDYSSLPSGGFGWPVPEYVTRGLKKTAQITSPFADVSAVHPNGHTGTDLAAGGSPPTIVAAQSGTVIIPGFDADGYGNYVIIKHANNYYTLYGHMSQLLVTNGQSVSAGQPIGIMGTTGHSTGVHLHFEIRSGGTTFWNSNPLDPMLFYDEDCKPVTSAGGSYIAPGNLNKEAISHRQWTSKADFPEIDSLLNRMGSEEIIARLISSEAGGEPYQGQVLVGITILNRTKWSGSSTIQQVATDKYGNGAHYQYNGVFEPTNPSYNAFWSKIPDQSIQAALEAIDIFNNRHSYIVNGVECVGAQYFYTGNDPVWNNRTRLTRYGGHSFY